MVGRGGATIGIIIGFLKSLDIVFVGVNIGINSINFILALKSITTSTRLVKDIIAIFVIFIGKVANISNNTIFRINILLRIFLISITIKPIDYNRIKILITFIYIYVQSYVVEIIIINVILAV